MAAAWWLFGLGCILAFASWLVYSGREYQLKLKIRRPADEYISPPFGVRIVSSQYGIDFVRGVTTKYGKPLVFLRGLERPVSGLVPFKNLFPIDLWGLFSQDNTTWVHIPQNSSYQELRNYLAMDMRDRVDSLALENWALKTRYKDMTTGYDDEMRKKCDLIKDIKRKTTGTMVYPKSAGGFAQTKPPE